MIEEREKPAEKSHSDAQVSCLQLLGAINAKTVANPAPPSKGLLYVEALTNGKSTKAMIDTRATHNFVSVEEAKRLG